jgi:hypothetical protein
LGTEIKTRVGPKRKVAATDSTSRTDVEGHRPRPCRLGDARFVIVVDEDVDPFNLNQVMCAISVRANPAGDVVIIQ